MCELFGMSSRFPANVSFSLEEFARHGGMSGPHKDGWGIAFCEDKDVRLIRETESAAKSPCVEFIRDHKYPCTIVISHLRMATFGAVGLRNTQPFCRELGGRMHLFAHNGDLGDPERLPGLSVGYARPIGETDSELAFCHLMHRIRPVWDSRAEPSLQHRFDMIREFAETIRPLGPANFIYSDGDFLFAHGHKRTQPGKKGYHPPGLYWLCRSCAPSRQHTDIPGVELDDAKHAQNVALVATVPLTAEAWIPFEEGEVLVFKDGKRIWI